MKIAVLSEYFYPENSGGTPTDMSDLWRELKATSPDLDVDVITSRNLYREDGSKSALPRFEHWGGLNIKRLRLPKSNRPSMLLRLFFGGVFAFAALLELLRRRRYDLVFVVTNPPAAGGAAWLYKKLTGVRYLYLIHDLYPDMAVALGKLEANSLAVRVLKAFQRSWLCGASRVVVLGRCMKRKIVESYGLESDAVAIISSWGAITVAGREFEVNGFRRKMDFSGTVALYAGNFSEYSNIELIIDAARLLRDHQDLLFVFVGDGSQRGAIERAITKEGLHNVRLLPKVPREMMGEVLAACEIGLISLDRRMVGLGVPSKLYTILAAGRAVLAIVPEESEVACVIREEDCGINVATSSSADVAKAILMLADSRERLRQLGMNARHALEEKYMIENACDQFRTLFDECVYSRVGL